MKLTNKSINKTICLIFLFFPFIMVTGPAIPDIYVSLTALYSLIICLFFSKYLYQINTNFFRLLILFWIILVLSSLISDYTLFSLESSLPYIRFIFFAILIYILSKNNLIYFEKYIFILITLAVFLVALDTYSQFFFRNEIFGHKIGPEQNRLTGPFKDDERIVGSYLSKFLFISFGYLLYRFGNLKLYSFLPFIFLFFVYICIFLTGERMAFILTTFGILLVMLFNFKYLKLFLIMAIAIFISSLIILMNNDIVKSRMLNTTLQVIGLDYKNGNIERYKYNFIDSHYGAHYITALEIFKDNKVLGSGPKTFRIVCADNKYSKLKSFNINNRCSTHPHNFYMQILSETGIVGLSIFIISFLVFIIFTIKKIDLSNPLHNCTFITLILFLWPLQSTGSIFNNWYGLYLFYYMSILFILIFSKKDQIPDHLPE